MKKDYKTAKEKYWNLPREDRLEYIQHSNIIDERYSIDFFRYISFFLTLAFYLTFLVLLAQIAGISIDYWKTNFSFNWLTFGIIVIFVSQIILIFIKRKKIHELNKRFGLE